MRVLGFGLISEGFLPLFEPQLYSAPNGDH
jgi:hypothetical protein